MTTPPKDSLDEALEKAAWNYGWAPPPSFKPPAPINPERTIEEKEQLHPGPKHLGSTTPPVDLEAALEELEAAVDRPINEVNYNHYKSGVRSASYAATKTILQYLISKDRVPAPSSSIVSGEELERIFRRHLTQGEE